MPEHPLTRLNLKQQRWVFAIAFVSTLSLFGMLRRIDRDLGVPRELRRLPCLNGIVALQLACDKGRTRKIIAHWGEYGTERVKRSLQVDFLFIVGYVTTLSILGLWGANDLYSRRSRLAALANLIAWAPCVAGILDVVENGALLWQVYRGADSPWAETACFASVSKFILLGIACGYSAFSIVWCLHTVGYGKRLSDRS